MQKVLTSQNYSSPSQIKKDIYRFTKLTSLILHSREGQLPGSRPRRHELPRAPHHPRPAELRHEVQDLRDTAEPDAGHGPSAVRSHRPVPRPLRQGPQARERGAAARFYLQLSPVAAGPDQGPARQVDQGIQLQRCRQRGRGRAARGCDREEKCECERSSHGVL